MREGAEDRRQRPGTERGKSATPHTDERRFVQRISERLLRTANFGRFTALSCVWSRDVIDKTFRKSFTRGRNEISRGADDGIRTHTPLLAKTDFKSVASTVPPHRQQFDYVIFTM